MNRKVNVIIFNGPPGSGKDFAANYLVNNHPYCMHKEFKNGLIKLTKIFYGISDTQYQEWSSTQEEKLIPRVELNHKCLREALIYVSEKVIKPSFGQGFFGEDAANDLIKNIDALPNYEMLNFIFSDSGFVEEFISLKNKLRERKDLSVTFNLVRLYREGCNFNNDSRSYLISVENKILGSNPFNTETEIINKGDKKFGDTLSKLYFSIVHYHPFVNNDLCTYKRKF